MADIKQLVADIKAAITDLANGQNFPDLLAAVDELADSAHQPAPARSGEAVPDFIIKRIEREIESAKNPKGMGVHDGMARVHYTDLIRLLAAAQQPAQDGEAVAEGWREFVEDVSKQEPEKPDYWSSCGQCARNIDRADDLLSAAPQPDGVGDGWRDELELIKAVLEGYAPSIARNDAMRAVRALLAKGVKP